jgi:hypothetical protein
VNESTAAITEARQVALVGSGQMLLTLYSGGTFGVSYVLGAVSTLLFSGAMWRYRAISLDRATDGCFGTVEVMV